MNTAVVTVNRGVFRGLNLRQKTFLIIGFMSLLLLAIVISSLFVEGDSLPTDFGSKNLAPSLEHPFGTDWMGRDMFTRTMEGLGLSIVIGAFASAIRYCTDRNFRLTFKHREDRRFLCILACRPVSFNPAPSFDNPYFHRPGRRSNRSYYWSCINALDKSDQGCKSRNQAAKNPGIYPYIQKSWKIKVVDSHKTYPAPFDPPDIAGYDFAVSPCYFARSFGHISGFWTFTPRTGNRYNSVRVYEVPLGRILVACLLPGLIPVDCGPGI